jgi:hypothetical protein
MKICGIFFDTLAAPSTLQWRWVRGHAAHPDNERADALPPAGKAVGGTIEEDVLWQGCSSRAALSLPWQDASLKSHL